LKTELPILTETGTKPEAVVLLQEVVPVKEVVLQDAVVVDPQDL